MFRTTFPRSAHPAVALILALPLLGGDCLSGNDDDEGGGGTQSPLVGTWNIQESATSSDFNCTGTNSYQMVITSNGAGLQATYQGKGPYALSVSGESFSWTEAHTSDLGTYTITRTGQFTLTRNAGDDTLSGQGSFTNAFSNEFPDCSGNSTFTGQRAS